MMELKNGFKDVGSRGIPVTVVAVKNPGHWIVRAIGAFRTVEELVLQIAPTVSLFDQDSLEWTYHTYKVPSYLIYGSGDIQEWGWPQPGVYKFEHVGNDHYENARLLI